MENHLVPRKKVAVLLSIWSCFALLGLSLLFKVWGSGSPWRLAGASAYLTMALGFVLLLARQWWLQRPQQQ